MSNESVSSGGSFPLKPAKSAEEFAAEAGVDTVTMIFPRPVILTTGEHQRIEFKAGPQEVPADLQDHWYLKANGAVRYDPRRSQEKPEETTGQPAPVAPEATTAQGSGSEKESEANSKKKKG